MRFIERWCSFCGNDREHYFAEIFILRNASDLAKWAKQCCLRIRENA